MSGSLAQRKIDAQLVNFVASSRPGMTIRFLYALWPRISLCILPP
jgi:hypothetical protein